MATMKSERLGRDFDVEIIHAGLVLDPWGNGKPPARGVPRHMDHWLVVFRLPSGMTETVDFYTGLGHRKLLTECLRRHKDILALDPGNVKYLKAYRDLIEHDSRPVAPKLDDVLHSLSMDTSALATYEACQKSAKQLIRITGECDLGKIAEAFADY